GWHKECNEQYPSLPILREAAKRRIPVIVNADAHDPAHLQRDFLHASEILLEAGYPKRSF
ncbi:MAG: histidinol phosphate phosphatase, partial [Lentisphaeria bacterium]|nr:histidinol phosphate phosphatase [Lentisphaeria bacterium]